MVRSKSRERGGTGEGEGELGEAEKKSDEEICGIADEIERGSMDSRPGIPRDSEKAGNAGETRIKQQRQKIRNSILRKESCLCHKTIENGIFGSFIPRAVSVFLLLFFFALRSCESFLAGRNLQFP